MADKVPADYDEVTVATKFPAKEPGLDKVRQHYLKKGCKVYVANKKALSKKNKKGADFIVVCPTGDGRCVAIIEVKDGNSDCKDAIEQIKGAVAIAQAAGYVDSGANPNVSICVFNGELHTMADEKALGEDAATIDIGSAKKKPEFINKKKGVAGLPC